MAIEGEEFGEGLEFVGRLGEEGGAEGMAIEE